MAVSELCSRLDAPLKREEESANQKRATVRGEELTLTNTLQLTAIVELRWKTVRIGGRNGLEEG